MSGRPELATHHVEGRMLTHAASALSVRHFPSFLADEPPSRGGADSGPTPLETVLMGLLACTNASCGKLAETIGFAYSDLRAAVDAEIDLRGRKGTADVPVHWQRVRVHVRIATDETDARLAQLQDLVARYCPVDSLFRAAVPDYEVTWERL